MEFWYMGAKINPDLLQSKLSFVNEPFIHIDEVASWVKETKRLYDNIEKTNDECDLHSLLSQVTGMTWSDEVESQAAIDFRMTDIYKKVSVSACVA